LDAQDYALTAENLLNSEERFKILINTDKDLSVAVRNASVALSSSILVESLEKNNRLFEYLDLRFPPKVFYKLRPVI